MPDESFVIKVDVWLQLPDQTQTQLRKVTYAYQNVTVDEAKRRASETYKKDELPQLIQQLLAVSWEGPLKIEPNPAPAGTPQTPQTS